MKPTISVIIPCYQPPKLQLRKCINSLLQQTFSGFELIIMDDGNSFDYEKILNDFQNKDKRIRVIRQQNAGVSVARNRGLEAAAGEYISFIDSDDFVEEIFLEKLYKSIQGNELAICGVCEQEFWVDNAWNDRRMFFSQPTRYNGLQYINFTVNKLYLARIIKDNNISFDSNIKLGEDALFLAKYYRYCNSIRCISDRLYHYVPNAMSAVHNYQAAYWEWEEKVIDAQWKMFHQYPLTSGQEQAMLSWLFRKFKGAINYYYTYETERKKQRENLRKIYLSPNFKYLNKTDLSKENKHLSKNEKRVLRLWLKFGLRGIEISKQMAEKVKRTFIRRFIV